MLIYTEKHVKVMIILNNSMGDSNTVVSAYTMYRHGTYINIALTQRKKKIILGVIERQKLFDLLTKCGDMRLSSQDAVSLLEKLDLRKDGKIHLTGNSHSMIYFTDCFSFTAFFIVINYGQYSYPYIS